MTSEENEKRDCREARFSLEGRKPCPNLGKHLNLSVNNIVHELNSVVQKRRRFATRRRVRECLTSQRQGFENPHCAGVLCFWPRGNLPCQSLTSSRQIVMLYIPGAGGVGRPLWCSSASILRGSITIKANSNVRPAVGQRGASSE